MKTSNLKEQGGLRRMLCLAALLMVFSLGSGAYTLKVAGYDVKSSNASNVTGDRIKAYSTTVNGGKPSVVYNESTKTLTLWNVKIERDGSGNRAILNEDVSGLTVILKGKNYLKAVDSSPLRFNANTTLKCMDDGNSKQSEVIGGSEDAITVGNGASLTIVDADLAIKSNSSAFDASGNPSLLIKNSYISAICENNKSGDCYALFDYKSLTIEKSTVNLTGYSQAIRNLSSLTLGPGMYISIPSGGQFNSSSSTVVNSSGSAAKWVDFMMSTIEINSTNFPDENFRNWVLAKDKDKDGYLIPSEIANVKEIDVSKKNITSLKGIEHFTALQSLYCNQNSLTSLDVSKNTALVNLRCNSNNLTSLDVSKNTALLSLDCNQNSLTALDVSKNTALTDLQCRENNLKTLYVSKNTALQTLYCDQNSLTSLDVSKNTALQTLLCYGNDLTALDVSKNTALQELYCYINDLTALDVSKNTALQKLYCQWNSLKKLDVSKNTALRWLDCYKNRIRGEGMTTLINSLPVIPEGEDMGELDVYDSETSTGNVMTAEQVNIAKGKRWKVYKYESTWVDYDGLPKGDVNANGSVNYKDVEALASYIMGKLPYADKTFYDVDGNGKVNAADIVYVINILNK